MQAGAWESNYHGTRRIRAKGETTNAADSLLRVFFATPSTLEEDREMDAAEVGAVADGKKVKPIICLLALQGLV